MAGQTAPMSTPIFDELLREMSPAVDAPPPAKPEQPPAPAHPGGKRRRPE